jgi:transcription termination/antitermination protein NusG
MHAARLHAFDAVLCGRAAKGFLEFSVMNAFVPGLTGRNEGGGACPPWYAIWTRSHSEQMVADQLLAKGLDIFLPKLSVWSRRGGVRRAIRVPMFSGYLFLRADVDKNTYLDVIKARGVVRMLGERWDCLSPISYREMEALQQLVNSGLAVTPHSYLREGQRVRVTAGPLKGVDGILIENRSEKGILILSVELLRRSVAVQIDCTWVAAA